MLQLSQVLHFQLLLSSPAGCEYVKVVLQGGRMVGAVLIGDTDLEVRPGGVARGCGLAGA